MHVLHFLAIFLLSPSLLFPLLNFKYIFVLFWVQKVHHSATKRDRSTVSAFENFISFHIVLQSNHNSLSTFENKWMFNSIFLSKIKNWQRKRERFALCVNALFSATTAINMHSMQCSLSETTVDVDNVRYYDLSTEDIWIFNFISRHTSWQSRFSHFEKRNKKDRETNLWFFQANGIPYVYLHFFFSHGHRLDDYITRPVYSLSTNVQCLQRHSIQWLICYEKNAKMPVDWNLLSRRYRRSNIYWKYNPTIHRYPYRCRHTSLSRTVRSL